MDRRQAAIGCGGLSIAAVVALIVAFALGIIGQPREAEPIEPEIQQVIVQPQQGPSSTTWTAVVVYTQGFFDRMMTCSVPAIVGREDVTSSTGASSAAQTRTWQFTFDLFPGYVPPGEADVDCRVDIEGAEVKTGRFTITEPAATATTEPIVTATPSESPAPTDSYAGTYKLSGSFGPSASVEYWKGQLGRTNPDVTGNNMELTVGADGRVTAGTFFLEVTGTAERDPNGIAFCATVEMVILSTGVASYAPGQVEFTADVTHKVADLDPDDDQPCTDLDPRVDRIVFQFHFVDQDHVAVCLEGVDDTSRAGCLAAPLALLARAPGE